MDQASLTIPDVWATSNAQTTTVYLGSQQEFAVKTGYLRRASLPHGVHDVCLVAASQGVGITLAIDGTFVELSIEATWIAEIAVRAGFCHAEGVAGGWNSYRWQRRVETRAFELPKPKDRTPSTPPASVCACVRRRRLRDLIDAVGRGTETVQNPTRSMRPTRPYLHIAESIVRISMDRSEFVTALRGASWSIAEGSECLVSAALDPNVSRVVSTKLRRIGVEHDTWNDRPVEDRREG